VEAYLVTDLVDLALAKPDNPELRLEKMFDWYFAQELEVVKWALGAASAILVALLPALIDPSKFNFEFPAERRWLVYIPVNVAWLALITIFFCIALASLKLKAMSERTQLYVPSLEIVLSITGRRTP
jgi:hypothetical protein